MRQGTSWGVIAMIGVLVGCSSGQASSPAPGTASISGTYVASGRDPATDRTFVEALRLTQSAPGQFTGTLESTTVTRAGQSASNTQNVIGSYDGNHVTIAIGDGLARINRDATWSPGVITVSWMQEGKLAHEPFEAKTDTEYGAVLQALDTKRQHLAATDAALTQAKQANEATSRLVEDLQQFLAKQSKWSANAATSRHQKSLAFADRGLAKVKALLAQHESMADVGASNVAVAMNTQGIELGLALDSDNQAVAAAQKKMAALDHAIDVSPCLAPDGSLVPNPLPACAPLPDLVARYRAVHDPAQSLLAQVLTINRSTRSDYDARLKEAQGLVAIR